MPMYESYLEKYYDSNQHHNNGADAILQGTMILQDCHLYN